MLAFLRKQTSFAAPPEVVDKITNPLTYFGVFFTCLI
jgi:hypothetical protein